MIYDFELVCVCDEVVWIYGGCVEWIGLVEDVVEVYECFLDYVVVVELC